MTKIAGLATAGLIVASVASAQAAAAPRGTFSVTNDARRLVECNLLINSKTRSYLKVHQGKTYHDDFFPGTFVQLACGRGVQDTYGPLKLGIDYRFVSRDGNRVAVVAGGGGA
jgi:hypothetical protein